MSLAPLEAVHPQMSALVGLQLGAPEALMESRLRGEPDTSHLKSAPSKPADWRGDKGLPNEAGVDGEGSRRAAEPV